MDKKIERQLAEYQQAKAKLDELREKAAPIVEELRKKREDIDNQIATLKEQRKEIDAELKALGQSVPRKNRANGGKVKETIEKLLDDGQEHDNDSILTALEMTKQTGYVGEVLKGLIDEEKIVRVRKGVYQKKA